MNITVSLFLYLSDPDKNNEKGGGFNQTAIVQSDVKNIVVFLIRL